MSVMDLEKISRKILQTIKNAKTHKSFFKTTYHNANKIDLPLEKQYHLAQKKGILYHSI